MVFIVSIHLTGAACQSCREAGQVPLEPQRAVQRPRRQQGRPQDPGQLRAEQASGALRDPESHPAHRRTLDSRPWSGDSRAQAQASGHRGRLQARHRPDVRRRQRGVHRTPEARVQQGGPSLKGSPLSRQILYVVNLFFKILQFFLNKHFFYPLVRRFVLLILFRCFFAKTLVFATPESF